MSEQVKPYRVECRNEGCDHCGHGDTYDIILSIPGEEETAMSQSWGDEDEANDICEMLNTAWADATRRALLDAEARERELLKDKERIDKLEKLIDRLPYKSLTHGKWEYAPWTDAPKYETLRDALDEKTRAQAPKAEEA